MAFPPVDPKPGDVPPPPDIMPPNHPKPDTDPFQFPPEPNVPRPDAEPDPEETTPGSDLFQKSSRTIPLSRRPEMTYSFHDNAAQTEALKRGRSADRMATFIVILAVLWLLGAAVMFTAAIKGSNISSATPAVSDSIGAAPDDAPATPAAP